MENLLTFKKIEELRTWLLEHHNTEKECWVIVKRGKKTDDCLWYIDVVYQALCFGWIDTTLKKLPSGELVQKLMPRSAKSNWTELNKHRCRYLIKTGQMHQSGMDVLPDLDAEFVIDQEIMDAFLSEPIAYQNFCNFPKLYQRVRIDNIQSYKKDKQLFDTRLEKLITTSKENKMYGQWDDYGILTEFADV